MASKTAQRYLPLVLCTGVALGIGCRMGTPLDRNVQISPHFGSDSLDQPPKTRLASAATDEAEGENAAGPAQLSLSDRSQASPSEPPAAPGRSRESRPPQIAQVSATEPVSEGEYAELLQAFQNSPPEVRDQAIRQLVATASHWATQSDQPSGIDDHLSRSLKNLPSLPEAADSDGPPPTRLASHSAESATPTAEQTTGESSRIDRALATSADSRSAVATASSSAATDAGPAVVAERKKSADIDDTPPDVTPAAEAETTAGEANLTDAELLAELLTRLGKPQPGESDGDRIRREIVKRFLHVLAGDPDQAVNAAEGMTAAEQEFLRHQLLAIWKITDAEGHPVMSRRLASALPHFRDAVRYLGEATEQLDVRSPAFCTEILSYGQVKRFADNRFEPGRQVILYCEIDNFVAEKTSDGYETELQGSYEIFDERGNKVAGQVLPVDRQLSDRYLRDYFIAYQMHLPSQLEPGEYRLELSMECVKGHKYGQASLPLTIKK